MYQTRFTRRVWHDWFTIVTSIQPSCGCSSFCISSKLYSRPISRTPETFDIVSQTVNVETRKNLAQVSRMLTQITNGLEFGDESPHYIPVNDYVRNAIQQTTSWLFEGRPTITVNIVFT